MEIKELVKTISEWGFAKSNDKTILRTYATTPDLNSLVSAMGGNRLQTGWKKAEIVIAKYCDNDETIETLLNGWKKVVGSYRDQYLCLEYKPASWKFYDSKCQEITYDEFLKIHSDITHTHPPLQQIHYGAPGTGKSNAIKELTKGGGIFSKDLTFRTTFHPDSDYASFVGAYKPYWNNEKDKIVYEFRPQTFLRAYTYAWLNPTENVALIIEEINRGNCAQIFGDIFQLLDRETNGLSKYPIVTDVDMESYLKGAFASMLSDNKAAINDYYADHYDDAFDKIKEGNILALPKNLSILATMNTSDQSLFPMDSAFKRRWEWVYAPIKDAGKGWLIELDGYKPIDWWEFLKRINTVVAELTTSEDKQLGYFFCMPDKGDSVITAERFVNKVIFYLWNDVFKDYAFDADCCRDASGKEVFFAQFYTNDHNINMAVLEQFFKQLKDVDGDEKPLLFPSKDTEGELEDAQV